LTSMEPTEPGIDQRFPKLAQSDIERLSRFGTMRRYAKGEWLYTTGQPHPGMFVIVSGSIALMGHEGLSRISPIVELKPGDFTAEIGQLSSQPSLVDAQAVTDVQALLVPPEQLRTLVVAEAELGERIMRALIAARRPRDHRRRRADPDRGAGRSGTRASARLPHAKCLATSGSRSYGQSGGGDLS
jgi:thioredoxin reductase (NADPH)